MRQIAIFLMLLWSITLQAQHIESGTYWYNGAIIYTASPLQSGNVLMNGLIFIVLSILVAYAFSYLGNTGWANLFLALFLLLVFANQYYFKWL